MHILLLQIDIKCGDPEFNTQRIINEMMNIPEGSLVVAPELFLTGYDKESCTTLDFPNSIYYEKLSAVIEKKKLIFYGSAPYQYDGKSFNTGFLIADFGVINIYSKTHLFGPMGENDLFNRGNRLINTIIGEFRVGLSICYDLRFPKQYWGNSSVDIHLVIAEWPNTRIDHWVTLLKARAIENQCYVIGVNRVGVDNIATYGGHSVIYDPFGEIVASMFHENEEVLLVDLPDNTIREKINSFRSLFYTRNDEWL